MHQKYLKNDLVLLLLIIISLLLIIILVPFSHQDISEESRLVYKSYYVYDQNSQPITLSYKMLEYEDKTTIEIIEDLFSQNSKKISKSLKLEEVNIVNNKIVLVINQPLNTAKKNAIDCVVNSLLFDNKYKYIIFKYQDEELIYQNNLDEYYLDSPLNSNLDSFLYKDKNYNLEYLDNTNNVLLYKVKSITDDETVFKYNKEKVTFTKTREGIYYNNLKILPNDFKVNDTWEEDGYKLVIKDIVLQEDNTLLVTINITLDNQQEIIKLKQGLGLYSYELIQDNETKTSYLYHNKVFKKS